MTLSAQLDLIRSDAQRTAQTVANVVTAESDLALRHRVIEAVLMAFYHRGALDAETLQREKEAIHA